jgi:sRNA-binding carbon storage regulator CsrA
MALSLGVAAGSKIIIGDSLLKVLSIEDGLTITLDVDGTRYVVNDQERTEILPNVFVSCGQTMPSRTGSSQKTSRLAIEAPRAIQIDRVKRNVPAI